MTVMEPKESRRFVASQDTSVHHIDTSDKPRLSSTPILREYFGRFTGRLPGPQAFLVEKYPPNSTTEAHFHSTDQFQIFLPGSGTWYLRHNVTAPMLHYSDAYTTYGPFGSGETPLQLYTLRRQASEITGFMPKDRDKLVRRGRRNIHVDLGPALIRVAEPGDATNITLIEQHDDALAAFLVIADKDADSTWLPEAEGRRAAQYFCVLDGQLDHDGRTFGKHSLGWREPDTPPLECKPSGPLGFKLLVMQFPVVDGSREA